MPLCGQRSRQREKREESRWDAETCHLSQMSLSSEWTRSVVSNSPREMTSLIRDRLLRAAQRFNAFWLYYCEKVRWWIWIWNQLLEGLNRVWIRGSVVCLLTDKTSRRLLRVTLFPSYLEQREHLILQPESKNNIVLGMPFKFLYTMSLMILLQYSTRIKRCLIFWLASKLEQNQPICQVGLTESGLEGMFTRSRWKWKQPPCVKLHIHHFPEWRSNDQVKVQTEQNTVVEWRDWKYARCDG